MSGYNGSGVFTFTYNWVNDANNAIPITASRMDTEFADATGGFNLVICRDGQSTTTAAIPFAFGLSSAALVDISNVAAGQIKFPAAQNASANANTLDDYEEGTWVPVDASGAALSLTVTYASYIKIGRMVTVITRILYPVTADGSTALIGGLPFTVDTNGFSPGAMNTDSAITLVARAQSATTQVIFCGTSNANPTNSQLSGKLAAFTITYFSAS